MSIFRRRPSAVPASQASTPAEPAAVGLADAPLVARVEAPVEQVAPVSRSGRNMPIATAVGLFILIAALVLAWWDAEVFSVLLMLVCVAAVLEWRSALRHHDRRLAVVPTIVATLGMGIATYFGGAEGLVVALMVACGGVVAWRVGDERIENTMADAMASVLTLLWIPFLASFLILMETAGNGWTRVLILVLAVVGNDTGGLFAGMVFGKHPMAKRVSPKKTWEGFAGGGAWYRRRDRGRVVPV
ncbi:phosphatidate cytidylyltransferase [Demequina litorisediminis]